MTKVNVPPVEGEVISAIRFLTNQVENNALQAYWEDRNKANEIYAIINGAIQALYGLRIEETALASCPWPCGGKRCAPNC